MGFQLAKIHGPGLKSTPDRDLSLSGNHRETVQQPHVIVNYSVPIARRAGCAPGSNIRIASVRKVNITKSLTGRRIEAPFHIDPVISVHSNCWGETEDYSHEESSHDQPRLELLPECRRDMPGVAWARRREGGGHSTWIVQFRIDSVRFGISSCCNSFLKLNLFLHGSRWLIKNLHKMARWIKTG